MPRYGERVLDQLERFVEEVEADTSAELVVVLAHRSEPYLDVPFKVGSLFALATLAVVIFLPIDFLPELMLLDVALAFAVGYAAGRYSPWLTRRLTLQRRRTASVQRAARAAFVERGVGLTRERTGLLVFISWLEQRVELIPDVGLDKRIPLAEWNAARRGFTADAVLRDFPAQLPRAFGPIRALLGAHLPVSADNPDEVPNRPVVI